MKTIKKLLFVFVCIVIAAGCKNADYRKTKGGMPYKIYPGKGTQKVKVGDFIRLELTQKANDSVLYTTGGKLPIYLQVTATPNPYDISEVWTSMNVGDSIVATQMIDTFIARSPQSVPPQFKKGDRILTYAKITQVFANDTLARLDDEKGRKELSVVEIKDVEKYLADKKITAQKTPSGAFVQIINPGTGNLVDTGNYVSVNYTGTTFSGVTFDSNTDSAFQHVGPYPFVAGTGAMIKGFDEAVMLLRKGGIAKVYIPSMLAYGANPQSPKIKPFDHLIFDLEIKDIQEKMPTRPEMPQPPNVQKIDAPQQR